MELFPHQINFIKKCQEGIKLLKEKEEAQSAEKGNLSMIVRASLGSWLRHDALASRGRAVSRIGRCVGGAHIVKV
jgi:hypothetical protein